MRPEDTKMGLTTVMGPVNQGSMRMVKVPGDDAGASGGVKVSKKVVSPFRDCTFSDMSSDSLSERLTQIESVRSE